ncbi:uncharacterized protein LOC117327634 [Pecten maximus]|uniref:uncharacterized protein LOC117327634 n=1 Tax=Pecten maximus TaxID=6579 RepID=UPI001458CC36|nr:uncharacterized protein LOC117327634 [Pecten maximus]
MNTSYFSISFYLVLVFLQGAIYGAMAYRQRHQKRVSWRLTLLRKIYKQFDNAENLLRINDRRHSLQYSENPDNKAKMYFDSYSDNHLPSIECADETQIPCPTPTTGNIYYCISRTAFCDSRFNCPYGEDENPIACMFYKLIDMKVKDIDDVLMAMQETHDTS